MKWTTTNKWIPVLVGVGAAIVLYAWLRPQGGQLLKPRIPGTDAVLVGEVGESNPVQAGMLTQGSGQPGNSQGNWAQFRGPTRDGCAQNPGKLSQDWKLMPPRELWSLEVGEGYAGVAIRAGRVYLLDYNREAKQSVLRCLSLADGQEIWRFSYLLNIKRNHGMTRTVPSVTDQYVVALDSKCNVFCLDAASGERKWSVNLVNEFGATIPEWYAGQCPLVDDGKVILAPGGKDALLLALDLVTGKPLWQSPNPHEWKMTHSSIMPMDFAGKRQYLYCASKGVVDVNATDGKQLWETADWKISIATVPSPVPLPDGRIFLTGGYNAGSLMLQIEATNEQFTVQSLFRLPANVFGATQHTPIFKNGNLYGIRADGRFVCLSLDGTEVWSSGSGESFGLGSYLMAGDLIYALNDAGQLSLIDRAASEFKLLGQIHPLNGREAWAPMALADGCLLLRDLTRLVCLDVSAR